MAVLFGTAVPTSEGIDGDTYVRTTNGAMYSKAAGTWSLEFTPVNVANGKKWSEAPTASVANAADYFMMVQAGVNKTITQALLFADNVFTLKQTLTAAEIKTGQSLPILLSPPASGAGFYYRALAFDNKLNFNTTPFDGALLSARLFSTSKGFSGAQFTNDAVAGNADTFIQGTIIGATDCFIENDTLSVAFNNDSTVGDSNLDLYIAYQKVAI